MVTILRNPSRLLSLTVVSMLLVGCAPIQMGRTSQIESYKQYYDLTPLDPPVAYLAISSLLEDLWSDFELRNNQWSQRQRVDFFSSTACVDGRLMLNIILDSTDKDRFYIQGFGSYNVLLYDPLKATQPLPDLNRTNAGDYTYNILDCAMPELEVTDPAGTTSKLRLKVIDKFVSSEFEIISRPFSIQKDLQDQDNPTLPIHIKQVLTSYIQEYPTYSVGKDCTEGNECTAIPIADNSVIHTGLPGYSIYEPKSETEGLYFEVALERLGKKGDHYRIKYQDENGPFRHPAKFAYLDRDRNEIRRIELGHLILEQNASSAHAIISIKGAGMLKHIK